MPSFTSSQVRAVLTPLAAAASILFAAPVEAQTRRALLVGIDTYAGTAPRQARPAAGAADSARGSWSNLEGAVNDVEALHAVLLTRYGFAAADVQVLRNREATRARILEEARAWLIDGARAGDVRFFFYAGHGSQVANSRSREADKLDESLVPADSNTGASDIRDKELAALFAALDPAVLLTIVFDSCHSGSIGRGLPRITRYRYLEPDPRDVADPAEPPAPEQRGALVLSAAQDFQLAAETQDEEKRSHGLFSWALVRTLRSMPVNQSAERMFLQVRALMQSGGSGQEPVIAGAGARLRAPFLGVGTPGSGSVAVAVEQVAADGTVLLQGGLAAGVRTGTELRLAGDASGQAARLRVTEVMGLARSRAVPIDPASALGIKPGALFEVVRSAAPAEPALRVWIGHTGLPKAEVGRQAELLAPMTRASGMTSVDDPTAADAPLHMLQWGGDSWQLVSPDGAISPVGKEPAAAAVTKIVGRAAGATPALLVNLPLPAEAAAALDLGATSSNEAIELSASATGADYVLVGRRSAAGGVEYAWVRPAATTADAANMALPARTDWVTADDPASLAAQLREQAVRLAVLRGWLRLEPPADRGQFPYHISLKNAATGELRTAGPVRDREQYQVVLTLDEAMARGPFERRFVYVFAIDSHGRSTLLFPASGAGAVENRLPVAVNEDGSLPKEIPLRSFTVAPPFGVDTFMMLTSATQLPNPSVLEGDPVRTRSAGPPAADDPLSRLLRRTSTATRGVDAPVPADWSFERLTIQSVPAGGGK